jgi:hypothetical protein
MQQALADPELSVEHCKKFWKYINVHMAHLMGDVLPPNCPAPWMNLKTLTDLSDEVVACFDTVKTKDELADLMWSWFSYTERLNRWFFLIFPWELGDKFPLATRDQVEELIKKGELPEEARYPKTHKKFPVS